jgi:hypothetical protein
MAKLTDAQCEQIRIMRKEGKTYQEITDFFKTTYGVKLNAVNISKAARNVFIKSVLPGGAHSVVKVYGKKRGRPFSKHPANRQYRQEDVLNLDFDISKNEEFAGHIHAAFALFEKTFLGAVANVRARTRS